MATTFEINLKSVRVIENGTMTDETGTNGFIINFYHPNSEEDHKSFTRELQLKDDQVLDYMAAEPILHKLDKLKVEGSVVFDLAITSVRKSSVIGKVLKKIGEAVVKEIIGKIPGGSIITGAADALISSIFDKIEINDKVTRIGYGLWEIHEEQPDGDLPITLKVPKEIKIHRIDYEEDKIIKTTRTIKKDFSNCLVVLNFQKIHE